MENSEIGFQLDALATANEPMRQHALQTLLAHPEETLAEIIRVPQHFSRDKAIYDLIRHIGYPQNVQILPWLVERIDRNDLHWKELIATIASFSPEVIAPYLIALLWDRAHHQQRGWGYDVESVCALLLSLDSQYAARCGPLLAWLFTLKEDPHELDPSFLLDVLEYIGANCAIYALPCLLDYLEREPEIELRRRAVQLIGSFDQAMVAPYRRVGQLAIEWL